MTTNAHFTNQEYQTKNDWIHTDSSMPPVTPHLVRARLKAEGRNALLGHLGLAVGCIILYLALTMALNAIVNCVLPTESGVIGTVLSLVFFLFISAFTGIYEYGLICIYLKLQFGQTAHSADFFLGFRENQDKIVILRLVPALIEVIFLLPATVCSYLTENKALFLLYLALLILGIAATVFAKLLFYPSLYLLLDYPHQSAGEILQKSVRLMKGHKKELLFLELSFLPLWLLTLLSFGAAGLWVSAYQRSTLAAYYRRRTEE